MIPRRALIPLLLCAGLPLLVAQDSCGSGTCADHPPISSGDTTCPVPGYEDRGFDLHLPLAPDPDAPFPVVFVFHGGGSNKEGAATMTCPGGDTTSPECMSAVADERGYAVVYPNGTGAGLLPNVRTWNAGGGVDHWQCVSGNACADGVDDLAYFDALLAEVRRVIPVDEGRIYATGMSNGGAFSHRLACQRAEVVAAVAPVSGANQQMTSGPCEPARPVGILHIHGTADPCWAYEGGPAACAQTDGFDKVSVAQTMEGDEALTGWVARQGCQPSPTEVPLPDVTDDGTTAAELRYGPCAGGVATTLLRIEGGGHVWPGGQAYKPPEEIGAVCTDFNASRRMLDFFDDHIR